MNKEQLISIIQSGHHTDGDLADSLLTELAKAQEPFGYYENGRWSIVTDGGPDKWRARKEYTGPLYTHPALSVPTQVTCQLYGHVVGACDECNTHTEKDVNETNKRLADNYLKLTCGIAPSVPKGWTAVHLKTGNEYQVIGEAIDATNMHCNQLMVIYQRDGKTFVREAEEFQEKFKASVSAAYIGKTLK